MKNYKYDYTDEEFEKTAIDIINTYAVLKAYDERLSSKRLDEMMSSYKLLATQLKISTHDEISDDSKRDLAYMYRMLNTPSADYNEEKRKALYKKVLQMAKDGKIADINVLMPPTEFDLLGRQIMNFYASYSPQDWACSQDGWFDKAGEPTQQFELDIKTQDRKIDDLYSDLHWAVDGEGWKKKEREDAKEIIDTLRKFTIDPIPDRLQVVICEPGKMAKREFIDNGSQCLKEYEGRKLTNRNCGDGIWCYYATNGLRDDLPKGRMLYDAKGMKLGVARGTTIFTARDYHLNFCTLSSDQMSLVLSGYGKPNFDIEEKPAEEEKENENEFSYDANKSQILLHRLMKQMANDPKGIQYLTEAGVSEGEISQMRFRMERQRIAEEKKKLTERKPEVKVQPVLSDDGGMKMK